MVRATYQKRSLTHSSGVVRKLFTIIDAKKTNLCVSADVTSTDRLLELADTLGPYICLLKTHMDIIDDFDYQKTVIPLVAFSKKHNFMIFEDRKFADIGNTVAHQYSSGIYKIVNWADLVTVHGVPGLGLVNGLEQVAQGKERGALMLAELSCKGSLATGNYTKQCIEIASQSDFVSGFIAQERKNLVNDSNSDRDWLILTPGVSLSSKGDKLGQQYRTPSMVIEAGTDVIIVGRGIIGVEDPISEAKRYKEAAWIAYEGSLN